MTRDAFCRSLSIVMQGPLHSANIEEVAATCQHWRRVLPAATLIVAVSETGETDPGPANEALLGYDLPCDEIVLAAAAERLPPVKAGLGANHVNLQIEAARAGLDRISTAHVLRIRNDMIFADDQFVDFYLSNRARPRGAGAIFGERVLISPWFTLNPLTLEPLPFHLSDWFHLGDTRDVRALWNVSPMTLADATHYQRSPMRTGTGPRERGFHSRLAVEQHLVVEALRALGHPVTLDFHNDLTDIDAAWRLIADDFLIADFDRTPIVFDKYRSLQHAHDIDLVCITHADWLHLVGQQGQLTPSALFASKIAKARAILERETRPHAASRLRRLVRHILRE